MTEPVELRRRTPLDVAEAWRRVTTWERHGSAVPLTRVRRLPGPDAAVGTRFVARTALGPVGFDDVMEVTAWRPPDAAGEGFCRIEKRGGVVTGWAEIEVEPDGIGSVVTWRELAEVPRLGRIGNAPGRFASKLLFGRLLDRLLAGPG